MKKVNVFWPTVIAIALSCSLVSCHNDRVAKEYRYQQFLPNGQNYTLQDVFQPAKIDLDKYELEDIISVEDYLKQMENETSKQEESIKVR